MGNTEAEKGTMKIRCPRARKIYSVGTHITELAVDGAGWISGTGSLKAAEMVDGLTSTRLEVMGR
jgi:hypothetical protein